jgi:hypothetical protein
MPPSSPVQRSEPPLRIELELVRAEQADDAFAFRFARQTYLVRGPGGAYETVELPWSRELLRDLEELRRPDRDPATVARVGDMLRELLGAAGWARHEAAIVEARAARRRVHVTIRSAAAELYALPWELLTLRADGQHLGALDHVLLRYAWPGTATVAADEAQAPARLLVAWSAAGGGVPAAEQVKTIEEAAKACGRAGAVEVLPRASYGAIADALDAAAASGQPFRALHLLCHGAEAGSTFGLALDGEGDGRPAVVDAGRLQQLLAPYAHALRLVVVSACDGGNMGEPGNRIGSVAQRLHRAGVQYVLASRYPLSARGSTRMTGALYEALLGGAPVEQAFVEARTAASREVSQLDWASLQLYARPEDGDRGCVLAAVEAGPVVGAAVPPVAAAAASVPAQAPANRGSGGKLVGIVALVGLLAAAAYGISSFATGRPQPTPPAATPEPVVAEQDEIDRGSVEQPATVTSDTSDTEGDTAKDTEGDTAADTEDDTGTTSSGPEPPESKSSRTKAKPKGPALGQPTPRCSAGVKEQILDRLKSPSRGIYKVTVWAQAKGDLTILECRDCGDERTAATTRTAFAKVRAYSAEDVLPCKITVDWQ